METTKLTVIERAAVALGSSKAEAELTALALKSKSITVVTSPDGRTECHAAAMTAKGARVAIEKAAKAARDDATQFSKAVIGEEKRLVALIEPEESRLIALRDEWDARIAKEKAAKAEAERLRIAAIKERIERIRSVLFIAPRSSAEIIAAEIQLLESNVIDDSFGELYGEAVEVRAETLAKLREIYAEALHAEAEAIRIKAEQDEQFARIKAEREELARQREDQAKRDAEAKAAREQELREIEAMRAAVDATQKALAEEQARIAREAAEKKAQEETAARKVAETYAAAQNAADDGESFDDEAFRLVMEINAKAGQMSVEDLKYVLEIMDILPKLSAQEKLCVVHYCKRSLSVQMATA